MRPFIKGMDLSTLLEVEECGGKFSENGKPGDAMEILRRNGMNLIRLRLWNDPYSESGEPYGAGVCGLKRIMSIAKRGKALGVGWMLNFHYSDFWADPGKQTIPKAWRDLDLDGLVKAVYGYTLSVLNELREADLVPEMAAVGNELTNGLLWEWGRRPDFENITKLVGAGIRAVRDFDSGLPVVVHLDNGGNNKLYREWFDSWFAAGGEDFDIIGLSYYPFWHGSMDDLRSNMNDIALRYGKELFIVETSTGFTLEDYAEYEKLPPEKRKGMAAKPELAAKVEYPMTPEGQCDFFKDLAEVVRGVPENKGLGFVCWEPAWIPVPGSEWATEAALAYTGEKGPGGNEWANQALFDYEGRALPAIKAIKEI